MPPMKILWMLVLTALTAGCALSPQTVALLPRIDVQAHPIGLGRELALEVIDRRPDSAIGARGGIYDTALITPRSPADRVLWEALAERLTASGFRVVAARPDVSLGLRVELLQLTYRASGQPVVNRVEVQAAIAALVRNGPRSLTGQYQANTSQVVFTAPSEAENERLINQVLGQALVRLLQDGEVLGLLAEPSPN